MTTLRMRACLLAGALTSLAVCALSCAARAEAQAAAASPPVASPPAPLPPEVLAELRGGFLSAGGVRFDFGVVVRSYVNNELALETRLRWTDGGPVNESVRHPVAGVTDLSSALADLAGAGLDLSGLSASGGVAVVDGDGVSALVHGVGDGRLQNLVFNAADGRALRQETAVTLTLPDLPGLQAAATIDGLRAAVGADLLQAQLGAVGR